MSTGSGSRLSRPSWAVTWVLAAVVCVVPVTALLILAGAPDSPAGWTALVGPVALGFAVVLARSRGDLATGVLTVSVLTVIQPAYQVLMTSGVWQSVAGLAIYAGICWVTGNLGRQLPVRASVWWIIALVVAIGWALDLDVPLAILAIGWWLVGVTFRHHQQLTARLRERAEELANEQQRYTSEAVRLERARIARELHDVVAHCMTVIVIQARAGQQQGEASPQSTIEALDAILGTSAEAETDLDTLVGVLDPHRPQQLTRDLLDGLVQRTRSGGTPVRLEVRGDPDTLDPARAAVAHRVIQEALTNALRHAPGAELTLSLDCRHGLQVTVENEPADGTAPPTVGSGRGLLGIDERVSALGGTTEWGPTPAGGWRLRVRLPELSGSQLVGAIPTVDGERPESPCQSPCDRPA
ncbi:MAG: histidine kinase [Microlunatus sp.]